jgi:hypothetical protein
VWLCAGYGNISPKTQWGRLAVVLYALWGIPLCLTFLGFLGGYMAASLHALYNACYGILWYFFCKGCSCLRKR